MWSTDVAFAGVCEDHQERRKNGDRREGPCNHTLDTSTDLRMQNFSGKVTVTGPKRYVLHRMSHIIQVGSLFEVEVQFRTRPRVPSS